MNVKKIYQKYNIKVDQYIEICWRSMESMEVCLTVHFGMLRDTELKHSMGVGDRPEF